MFRLSVPLKLLKTDTKLCSSALKHKFRKQLNIFTKAPELIKFNSYKFICFPCLGFNFTSCFLTNKVYISHKITMDTQSLFSFIRD